MSNLAQQLQVKIVIFSEYNNVRNNKSNNDNNCV